MNKILWFLILIITLYVLAVFKAPGLALEVEKIIGIEGTSEKVKVIKQRFDDIVTKMPSKEEMEDAYNGTITKIDETKEKLDTIRSKAGELEEQYQKTTEFIDETTKKIEEAKDIVNDIKQAVGTGVTLLSSGSTSTGTTE